MNATINQNTQEMIQVKGMSIHMMLWHIQTEMEVQKTKPNNAKFQYFSVEDIMTEFHKVQKKYPCTLTTSTEWYFDTSNPDGGIWMVRGIARLTSALDPSEFVEVTGTVMPSFASNIGSREQQCGSTNTYAKKSALANLLGLCSEQQDPDELPATPTTSGRDKKGKSTDKNVVPPAPPVPEFVPIDLPQAVAPVQAPQAAPAQKAAAKKQEPAQAKEETKGITITTLGDGKSLTVSSVAEPFVFEHFADAMDPMSALSVKWQLNDPVLGKYVGIEVPKVLKEIFGKADTQALHLIQNYLKDQTGENPIELDEGAITTLKAVDAFLKASLSKKSTRVVAC